MKHDVGSPRIASEAFNWNLTDQAGSARVETRLSHPLRSGGIAYAQRYNVNKDLFATVAKRDHDLFSEPHLEGMACPPSLLDAWIVAARQGRNAGAATTARSKPQIKRLRKAFEAMKHRISHALSSSTGTSFGAREEYRISWELFIKLDPSSAQQCGNHQPFWTLSTADVNKFMQWEFNRWISAIDFVRERGSRSNCSWEDHQRNMVLVTILLRSLKASVNCHHVARRSQMFKDKYKNRKGKSLRGLGFERSMRQSGLAWLPYELFDWSALHLRDELVTSTTFTFNGLQGKFWNWKNVESVNRQYGIARELEGLLQRSEPGDRAQILDRMRKMVYQHLALQVIGQLGVKQDISDEHVAILQGHHGLSFDIAHALVGEIPYLSARARGGKHGLGGTYPERVQTLFNWDDGITRTFWDHCFYRQLARRFYGSISTVIGLTDANEWRSTLGSRSLPYFWIIPHYDKHSLFIRNKNNSQEPGANRPFISGLYQWSFGDTGSMLRHEERWLFGGDIYLSGQPRSLKEEEEQEENISETVEGNNTQTHVIDFGYTIPFSEIPQIIEEGFKACRLQFADGDQRILAHYETARECLAHVLGNPLCDLLLMIVLTLSSSTVTPRLPVGEREFKDGPRKDPKMFSVSLTTRMLWFLCPSRFPWETDDDNILQVPEMAKKIG